MSRVFIFGVGYTARFIADRLAREGYDVAGTTRSAEKVAALVRDGIKAHIFSGAEPMAEASGALAGVTHLVASVQPDAGGDPVLRQHAADIAGIAGNGTLRRIAYLSTTAVYGDHAGGWIDEDTPLAPLSDRARHRVAAETEWHEFAAETGIQLDVFRLSGIYGPGRNQVLGVRSGKARRIVKRGQVFNRIHAADIASAVAAAFDRDLPGATYNLADDEPAPPQEVVAYAARLAGVDPPPEEVFDTAEMSAMARSFYSETKRIANARVKSALGVSLAYPTYREGLAALAGDGE